jgi:hypothetical protein
MTGITELNQRKKNIEKAKEDCKKAYGYICVVCGSEEPSGGCFGLLDGAHLAVTNYGARWYDPADKDNIFPAHRSAHNYPGNDSYDEQKTYEGKRDWLIRRVRINQEVLVKRLDIIYGETEAA